MKLLIGDKEYIEYIYPVEEEFERDIVKLSKKVFGNNTIYIDVKKLLKSNFKSNGSIPDGYLIDYNNKKNPKLYLVENETRKHTVRDHIGPQLMLFYLNYKSNVEVIKEIIIKECDNKLLTMIAEDAGYRNYDDMLTNIILKEKLNVIIPIDEITEELIELKGALNYNIELLQFKKYISDKNDVIYMYDEFYPTEIFNFYKKSTGVNSIEDIDTIIVPAEKEGFEKEFINNNRWYAVKIGINMLDKLKYIAVYQKSPVKAITYYAEIADIKLYQNTDKYIIYFKDNAKKLTNPIKLNPNNPSKAPQGRVYTSFNKIINADSKTTLDDIF